MREKSEEKKILEEFFEGDELAQRVYLSKYSYNGELPEDTINRLVNELDKIESNYRIKGKVDPENLTERGKSLITENGWGLSRERITELLSGFNNLLLGGSIISGLGTENYASLSNCWVNENPVDSIDGINKSINDMDNRFKRRGGVGVDLSSIRPADSKVNNSAKSSTGIVPLMKYKYSSSAMYIAQNGRRGALMLSLSVASCDIMDFITAKQDDTSITTANISVKVDGEFMKAVKEDTDFYCRYPITANPHDFEDENNKLDDLEYGKLYFNNNIYIKKYRAKDIWDKLIECAHAKAEPGILYWDTCIDRDPNSIYEDLRPIGVNPCVSGDTLILTNKGYKRIDSLLETKVNIWNGYEWSEVQPRITGHDQPMLKIKFSDGSELKCTDYHKFILDGKDERVEAKNLKVDDKLVKCNFPIIEAETPKDDGDGYTQGFYSGDGYKHIESGKDFISFYEKKFCCIDFCKDIISRKQDEDLSSKYRTTYRINVKHNKEFVPNCEYSINYRLNWLAGIIDSDGSRNSEEGAINISSINREFLLNIKYLLNSLGCNGTLSLMRESGLKPMPDGKGGYKEYYCQDCFRLVINSSNVKKLFELGLNLHRVSVLTDGNRDASRFVRVTSIERIENEETVYCFNEEKNHSGIFNGVITGQCSEQSLAKNDSCRLLSLNLSNYVINPFEKDAKIDEDGLYKAFYDTQIIGDDVVDLEIKQLKRIISKIEDETPGAEEANLWKDSIRIAEKGRRTGIGILGLGDMFAMLGVNYGDEEILRKVFGIELKAILDSTTDMAIIRGLFEDHYLNRGRAVTEEDMAIRQGNSWYPFIKKEFPEQYERMMKFGRRNSSSNTCPPTGSLSIICRTTSGIEPLFLPYYQRKVKVNNTSDSYDILDADGQRFNVYYIIHPTLKKWIEKYMPDTDLKSEKSIDKAFKASPWFGNLAGDLDYKVRIKCQSIIQSMTSAAISSCVVKDTLIELNDGLYYIDELYNIDSIDENTFSTDNIKYPIKNGYKKDTFIKSFYNNGEKPTYTLFTEDGLKITCTSNEKFLVYDDNLGDYVWMEIKDIKPGSKIKI